MTAPNEPIGRSHIEARLATLAEYMKEAQQEVAQRKNELYRAEQSLSRIQNEISGWTAALEALKKAGVS